MADTPSGGRDGGHGGRRSGKHDGGRNDGRNDGRKGRRNEARGRNEGGGANGRRKGRRNEARERNEGGGANGAPDDLNGEEECAHPLSATSLCPANPPCRITLFGGPIMPLQTDQQIRNGERYCEPEGGPGNGYVLSLLLLISHMALTLPRQSYAGQNEPFPGNRGPENAFVYPLRISHMALTLRRWPYVGQNGPIAGAQQPGNNGMVQNGRLIGCVLLLALLAFPFCSVLTHHPRLDALPQYSQFDTWERDVSREYNPVTGVLFDFNPNGRSPARNA